MITSLDLTAADRARLNSGVEQILLKIFCSIPPNSSAIVRRAVTKTRRRTQVPEAARDKNLYVEDNDDNVYMLKMRFELLDGFEVLVCRGWRGRWCEKAGGRNARYHLDGS